MRPNDRTGQARALALALAALTLAPGTARAEEPGGTKVIVTGYLFATGLEGQASATSGLPAADIDLSFSDVLEDLDFGFMTAVEVRNGRFGFLGDLMYTNVKPSASLSGPLALTGTLDQESLTLQGSVLYRVHETEDLSVDLGAGLRYWNVKNVGTFGPLEFSHRETWADPVVMARMTARLQGPWSVTVAGDVGGSGAGSDLTWQLLGTLNYQKSDRLSFRGGYRVLAVDYESDGFVYDVTMQGPVFGVSMSF